jgi:hypothetical protein
LRGPEIIAREILNDLPPKSIVILNDDNLVQPLMYMAYVESKAPSISILSSNDLLNERTRRHLTDLYPHILFPVCEAEEKYKSPAEFIRDIWLLNASKRRLYVQAGITGLDYRDIVPERLLFRYAGRDRESDAGQYAWGRHLDMMERIVKTGLYDQKTIDIAGRWLFYVGQYYESIGNPGVGWILYNRAMTIDQSSTFIRVRLADGLAGKGYYRDALKLISEALEIDAHDPAIMEIGYLIEKKLKMKEQVNPKSG